MIDRFLTLGRQTIVYGLGGAALQLVGVLTVPIFTRLFDASQYGTLETTIAAYSALVVLADLGLTNSAQRSYFDYDEARDPERRSALSTALSMSMLLALMWTAVALVFASPVSQWQFGTSHYAALIRIAAVSVPVAILCNFLRETVRLKMKPWAYTISMSGGAIIGTGFAIIDAVVLHGGIASLLWGLLVGNAFSALVSFSVLRGVLIGRFSRVELARMLRFSLPLIPVSIALWGVSVIDRSLLTKLGHGGTASTGEYALANRFSSLLLFVVTAFMLAYGPFQLSLWQEDPELEKRVRARMLTYLSILLVGSAVFLSLFAREIAQVVSPRYPTAYQAVGMLTMAVAVLGVSNLPLVAISLTRRTGYAAIYTTAALVLNIGLNVALIPTWGMMGSAFATLAAYILLAALYYWRSQVLYRVPFQLHKTLIIFVAGGLATLVGLIRFHDIGLALGVKAATLVGFAASLWLLRVLDPEDYAGIRLVLAEMRPRRRRAGPVPVTETAETAEASVEVPAAQSRN